MARCNKELPDGSVCRNTLYECRQCGHVGCYGHNTKCPYSLRDEFGKCRKCGSITMPKKHVKPRKKNVIP